MVNEKLKNLLQDFMLSDILMQDVYRRFCRALKSGLGKTTNATSDVKCWVTYVQDLPTGNEAGKYLALDLGGSHFRILCVTLNGQSPESMDAEVYPVPKEVITGSGENLFDHIAECLRSFIQDYDLIEERLPLGFTFGFPCLQLGLDRAVLVRWTKGFKCTSVEGEDVGRLLKEALERQGGVNIDLAVILNDTIGTLISCAHRNPDCRIGTIVGTGTNACYVERSQCAELLEDEYKGKSNIIINTEWGAFGDNGSLDFIRTEYDKKIDDKSLNKGQQMFEKMISGMYLGELVRMVLKDAVAQNLIFVAASNKFSLLQHLSTDNSIETSHLAEIERDDPRFMKYTKHFLEEHFDLEDISLNDCKDLRFISEVICQRSANLVALGLSALINKINLPYIVVGMDGSVYRFHPRYDSLLRETMRCFVHPKVEFDLMLSEDGSGRGAAVIAAVTCGNFASGFVETDDSLKKFVSDFIVSDEVLKAVYDRFDQEIRNGLGKATNAKAEVKCSITYIQDLPTGEETGKYLVLEFGSATFRVLLVTLNGKEEDTIEAESYAVPRDIMGGTAEQLFDLLADNISNFMEKNNLTDEILPLAFTFPFPCMQTALDEAKLIFWTKGFQTSGVVGEDVGQLLSDAIKRRGNIKVDLVAILSHTTGTLMSCAYRNPNCRIGIYIGLSLNGCYAEQSHNVELLPPEYKSKPKILINTELNTFGDNGSLDFVRTDYDQLIDGKSVNKGHQFFEKMISGKYLGEIVRLILIEAIKENLIFETLTDKAKLLELLSFDDSIEAKHLADIERDDPRDMTYTLGYIKNYLKVDTKSKDDALKLRFISEVVCRRAACFAGVVVSVLVNKVKEPKVTIGFDGVVFRYHPKFPVHIRETMRKFIDKTIMYEIVLTEDGGGRGGAIIAAVCGKR